jgi:hypothetical protein
LSASGQNRQNSVRAKHFRFRAEGDVMPLPHPQLAGEKTPLVMSRGMPTRSHISMARAPFPRLIPPCLPTLVKKPPSGSDWLHEVKWDGYRFVCYLQGRKVRMMTRNALDWSSNSRPSLRPSRSSDHPARFRI